MNEKQSNPNEPNYWSADELIHLEIEKAQLGKHRISHAAARTIASRWHGGQASEMYSFVSTSAITDGLKREIERELENPAITDDDRAELLVLQHYVQNRLPEEYLGEWSALYLEQPDEDDLIGRDACEACGAHISEPHAEGCPLDPGYPDELE